MLGHGVRLDHLLANGYRLACQQGLVDLQIMIVEEHSVGWHAITVAKDDEVASDDVPAGDTPAYSIPHHEGPRTGQVAQGF
ncbi:hypothetical protein A6X20_18475 [Bradyrhizobium elkanii]|jgi:hypothetical protein|nr:hypothetical protein A6X20_18475 [Bradyrhizobium elkanii]ODM85512.1 hypothetical protein A6452_13045 [Bradyrhizobium elkanii]